MTNNQKVILKYHFELGLSELHLLNDLEAPPELIKKATEIANKITKIIKKYRFRPWSIIFICPGFLAIILANTLLKFPYLLIGLGVGFLSMMSVFIYICVTYSKGKSHVLKCFAEMALFSKGALTITEHFENKKIGNRVTKRKVLAGMMFQIRPNRLEKYLQTRVSQKHENLVPLQEKQKGTFNLPQHKLSINSNSTGGFSVNMNHPNSGYDSRNLNYQNPVQPNLGYFHNGPVPAYGMPSPNLVHQPVGQFGQGILQVNPNILNMNHQGPQHPGDFLN
jgi:hypothetical protein